MRLVIVESPYRGRGRWWLLRLVDRLQNVAYARRCLRDSLMRGEAPLASHLLYTQPGVLRDHLSLERRCGIEAGLAWSDRADLIAVYEDRGVTDGMLTGVARHEANGVRVQYRSLYK